MTSSAQHSMQDVRSSSIGEVDLTWVERLWKTVVLQELDSKLREGPQALSALGCGFTHAVLYHGPRVHCDTLIKAAAEQVAAMDTIRAFTDRTAAMYFDLVPSHHLLYLRQVPVRERTDVSDAVSPPASRPFYFVALGPEHAVRNVSSHLNALIDAELEQRVAATAQFQSPAE